MKLSATSGGEPDGATDAVVQDRRQREQEVGDSFVSFLDLKNNSPVQLKALLDKTYPSQKVLKVLFRPHQ